MLHIIHSKKHFPAIREMNRSDLHAYQLRAIDFICRFRKVMLALDMGLGKTASTLTALSDMLDACIIRKVLIIAPLRVANSVWAQEALKWDHLSHLRVSIATGPAQRRKDALNARADIYVINRENVPWLIDACKGKWPFDAVVIDESTSFKSCSSLRFKKLKKAIHIPQVVILLTGTPTPNGLMDIWSQMHLIDPQGECLGRTITGFRQRFFTPDYWGFSWEPKPKADEQIHALIKPRVLSMQSSDYLDLPDVINLVEKVSLPEEVMTQYREFEKNLFLTIEETELEAMSAAVLANKLLQFANGAIYHNESHEWTHLHDAKLDALAEIIETSGENMIVAYNYRHDLARLQKRFPHAITLDKNPETINQWNAGKIPLLLCHPQSAGHGLNLQQGGSMLVWFGLTWNLEHYQQTCARLHRQGQNKPVRIIHIISEGTIDERLISVLNNKQAVQQDLLNALK